MTTINKNKNQSSNKDKAACVIMLTTERRPAVQRRRLKLVVQSRRQKTPAIRQHRQGYSNKGWCSVVSIPLYLTSRQRFSFVIVSSVIKHENDEDCVRAPPSCLYPCRSADGAQGVVVGAQKGGFEDYQLYSCRSLNSIYLGGPDR
ncbi:hypothetical protein E2C01_037985 [Portunus trituberculatus]|uniref:Uncharacterized protein n=1 Tax=Portunus trituberculatus TaxID=210409 RepID=A0A5B7FGR6_PORTR|nr:hypothetical protein [Portunus trituberculatus]